MRLDLLSYIRQLMLPHWKQPENIGLAQVLFQPIQSILTEIEAYQRTSMYRAGLTGQKLIMQHYLQEVIDGEIQIKDQDGLRWDFAVIVPQTLSAEKRRQIRDIVDTYKLASKRYEIRDAFALSGGGVIIISWIEGYPKYEGGSIAWAIDSNGGFLSRIKKKGTTVYILDEVLNYQAGVPFVLDATAGDYDIEVGGLYYQLYVADAVYSFSISSVVPIPGDTNGAWKINLAESIRGVRNFAIEWFKGASTTAISSFSVDNLDTNLVNYLYFNPKNEEPWHITSNGPGEYRVVVKHLLNGIAYADQKLVTFTGAQLGIPTGSYTFSISSVARIVGDVAWKIFFTEAYKGIRDFKIEWFEEGGSTALSTVLVNDLDTNTVNFLYFNPRLEEPWHIKSNGAGEYRVEVTVTLDETDYEDLESVHFTNDDLGIFDPVDPGEPGDTSIVSTGGIKIEQNEDGTWSIVDTAMSVSMTRTKHYAYDNSGVGAFDQGTESSNWIGYVLVNDVPLKAGNSRKDFTNMVLPINQTIVVRVIWLEEGFYNNWSQVKDYFWKVREPRIIAFDAGGGVWQNHGEGYSQYHPWKFWKQAYAIIKT